jgi:hypothetical protein
MKRPDVILSIIAGALVLAFSVTLAVITVRDFFSPFSSAPYTSPTTDPFPDGPLETGDPGSPLAISPTACPDTCFTRETIALTEVDVSAYHSVGLDLEPDASLAAPDTTAVAEHATNASTWRGAGKQPDDCFVTWAASPIVEPPDAATVAPDVVVPLPGGDGYAARLNRTARLFSDTASAVAYMTTLDAALAGCSEYTDADGLRTDVISREPKIFVPDSVGAAGWVRQMDGGDRIYVMDLQRANLVIRTVAYNQGTFTDQQFREFMEASADALGDAAL